MELTYILQIITISVTLTLGLITYVQTKKIQHGQNIIEVTTNYRSKRSEQLRECGETLMTNTTPEFLRMHENGLSLLIDAAHAYEKIGMILHRNFAADKELIVLAGNILKTAMDYCESHFANQEAHKKLLYYRELFKIKCDIYSSADWNRIKRETKGENTTAQSWIDYYKRLETEYSNEFEQIERKYVDYIPKSKV